ncbi:EF-hand domain-containing protein [Aminobacter anthyllidis]|uniref:EF-hand domain-containing protein n=1 Tax=Aminobacter anthyllidis TaxID=1035067 RepID=UPI002458C039|nr:EF-hand domain-containing protein [Aminobacter anthyllidis]MDH4988714.1 EF-hand domain-containing protein [Aminobacter anthyllidis]
MRASIFDLPLFVAATGAFCCVRTRKRLHRDGSHVSMNAAACRDWRAAKPTAKMRPAMTRAPKKSETLEIRIPHETKQALMARSRAEGRPASEVVRSFIDAYLAEAACSPPQTAWERSMAKFRTYSRPAMALLAAFVAVGGVSLAVSPATALPDLQAAFKELDANGNGVISSSEFGSGALIRKFKTGAADAPEPEVRLPPDTPPPGMMFVMRAAPGAAGSKPVILAVRVPGRGAGFGSPTEIRASEFAQMDLDHDGRLSFPEFEAHHRSLVDKAFAAVDADKDGFLSANELAQANAGDGDGPALIAAFDSDADGRLSRQEFMAPRR